MDFEHWFSLLNSELEGNSDRACVIVSASIIDHLLSKVVQAFLVPNSSASDTLFDGPNAPLGNFSARIDIAHRLGLISAQFARDLHLIRRMRNELAHSVSGRSFSDPGLADQVLHLVASLKLKSRAPFLLRKPYDSLRGQFIIGVIVIVVHLDDSAKAIPTLPALSVDAVYTMTFVDRAAEN
jgi:DNA-binding MltR family transcriptional regulator